MVETNEVLYPQQYDTILNFPSVTEITEATGEDLNRNRDAILRLERVLGLNPHIGLYTENPTIATVDERLDIIENGLAEGRFAYRNLNVNNALVVTTDTAGNAQVDVGGDVAHTQIAPVYIRGPFRVQNPMLVGLDSEGLSNSQAYIDVPVVFRNKGNQINSGSIPGQALLTITDSNATNESTDRFALDISGNVRIQNGRLLADLAVDHSQLRGIQTTPTRALGSPIHVARGDHHSHKRKVDPVTGAFLDEVDPNPSEITYGLVDHRDLLNINTKSNQANFMPVEGVPYHVTGGDEHNHQNGRGAQIDHNYLLNVSPASTNHVTSGDSHAHSPASTDGGAPISHYDLLHSGFLSHSDIDNILNVDYAEHISLIDPLSQEDIDTAQADKGHHVPQGHVSDPAAHHSRYTDAEALAAEVLITDATETYEDGQNTTVLAHIQALGSGTAGPGNPHGISAADINALEGFDASGNLPNFTQQFLETAIQRVITDPTYTLTLSDADETITGFWTFQNINGIRMQQGSGGPTQNFGYDEARSVAINLPVAMNHVNDLIDPAHSGLVIEFDPSTHPDIFTSTRVQSAMDELAARKYSFVTYTFTGQHLINTFNTYGFVFPANVVGEVVSVSAMHYDHVGGSGSIGVDVGLDTGGGTDSILNAGNPPFPSTVNIVGLPSNLPSELTLYTSPISVSAGDVMKVYVNEVGTGITETDVTVVVTCKIKHIA